MDFSLEEAFEMILELVFASGYIAMLLYFFMKVHTYI